MAQPSARLASYAEALDAVLSAAEILGPESVPLESASGRILAQEITAPFDLPRFDNTAVDGFAVHAADVEHANRAGSAELALSLVLPAGEALRGRALAPGATARVSTGSPVPVGTAAVVMQEDIELRGQSVRISAGIAPGQFIRRQGEEFRSGAVVARGPRKLSPPLCALAAGLGCQHLQVYRAARVGLLVTGSELVPPGQPLQDGQVYESNGYGLAAALRLSGIASLEQRHVRDDPAATRQALSELLQANDVVITSGGVSVGAFDAVKEAMQSLGVERRIWGVAIKPGRPFFFGVHRRGSRQTAVFGLPGNPMSASVTCALFVHRYLRALQGGEKSPRRFAARLESPLQKAGRRMEFVPVTVSIHGEGWQARPLDKRSSHMLDGLAQADALAEFPAESEKLDAGQPIQCQFLPWSNFCHD